ncbi:DUF1444 domain-containing protein [Listeria aquatica]|uniref:DUF1444 domain-containing protein n=1 Tax=Listeria aquatica TaxID=1494960 RepID=A0A841ZNK3_9LIST|nr:DUF1444 domain-containing protein [Listeria aquatica]MBC1520958.1 DUF1444 domain-containing protein [Listeria aquatica]
MTSLVMKTKLEERLEKRGRTFSFDHEKDRLTIREAGKTITLSLPQVIARFEEEGEEAIRKVLYYVNEGLHASLSKPNLSDSLDKVYPVIRSRSFPEESKSGEKFLVREHTAETSIYFVIDEEKAYHFITEKMLQDSGVSASKLIEKAFEHLENLPVSYRRDRVSENDFYFVRINDGYDASRILNARFLSEMREKLTGEMVVAIPHADVLIVADIQNETGFDVMAHMAMQFFAEGVVPITTLPFVYNDGKLEPIFIMAKNRPKE